MSYHVTALTPRGMEALHNIHSTAGLRIAAFVTSVVAFECEHDERCSSLLILPCPQGFILDESFASLDFVRAFLLAAQIDMLYADAQFVQNAEFWADVFKLPFQSIPTAELKAVLL